MAGSVSGNENSGENKIKPSAGLLFSDTFSDDRFGILADVAYADSMVRGSHVNVQGWEGGNPARGSGLAPCQLPGAAPCAYPPAASPPTGVPASAAATPSIKDWFIQDYGIYQEHTEDKRVGGRVVLQARPVDGLEITLDDNYSKETLTQDQYGFSVWFNGNGLRDVTQAPDGTVINFTQPGTPSDFQAQINQAVITSNTVGLNVKWNANAHNDFMFDVYQGVAKLNPGGQYGVDADVGYGNGPNATSLGIVVPGGKGLPYPNAYGPAGDKANFINPTYIGSHVLVESYNQNTNTVDQFKLEGAWHDDQLKFKYGVQVTHDHEALRAFTDLPYTWQMYAGYGPPPVGSGGIAPIPPNLISNSFGTGSNFIHGWSNGNLLPPAIIQANGWAILNYLQGLNGAGMNVGACSNLSGATPCTGKYIMYENLGGSQDITEDTVSPYFSLSTSTKIEDMPLKINIGARFEETHVTSAGISTLPTGQLYILPTDKTAYGFNSTPPVPVSTKSNYRYLLPNIDLSPGGNRYREGAPGRLADFDSSATEQFDAGSQYPVRSARGSAQRNRRQSELTAVSVGQFGFGRRVVLRAELLRLSRCLRERSDQLRRGRHDFTAGQRRHSTRRLTGDFQRHFAGQWPIGRGPRHRVGVAVHVWRYRLWLPVQRHVRQHEQAV